jgi:excisionase family DNA binding protein
MRREMNRKLQSPRGPSVEPPADAVFLTLDQVCRLTQLSRPSVIELVRKRRLAGFKVGRHWRIGSSSLQRFFDDAPGQPDVQ